MQRIYLDNNAGTPASPEVIAEMLPYFATLYGNPSSNHWFGQQARAAIEEARDRAAALIHAPSSRVFFTSGGSEANNAVIWGVVHAVPGKRHIIASRVEHRSVLEPLTFLCGRGYEVELLDVDKKGGLDIEGLKKRLRPDTLLVSLIGANNETGVLWPIAEIGGLLRERGILFHCDGVQMPGKTEIDVRTLVVDFLSMSGHKLHGPKGVGAVYIRRGAPFVPLIMGGGQENNLRAGTENVPGIVGFGKATELAAAGLACYGRNVGLLRDQLEAAVLARIPDALVNGAGLPRLRNTINISFKGASAEAMVQELDELGFAVSAHSACHSNDLDPSHVLSAMGVPEDYLHGTLRISLGCQNTAEEIDNFLRVLPAVVAKSRRTVS